MWKCPNAIADFAPEGTSNGLERFTSNQPRMGPGDTTSHPFGPDLLEGMETMEIRNQATRPVCVYRESYSVVLSARFDDVHVIFIWLSEGAT